MGEKHKKDQDEQVLESVALNIELATEINLVHKDLHPGDLCPQCQEGVLDYDGLLNLICQQCGYILAGCST